MLQPAQIKSLDAVVRHGSVRAAAAALYLSQPSVSIHIAKLERQLGFLLLHRSARGSVLTEAGQRMLPHLRSVLRAEEAARQQASGLVGGRARLVRVAGINSAIIGLLPDAVVSARERIPRLEVEVAEVTAGAVREGVNDGTYDIGLAADSGHEPPAGITSEELARGPLLLICASSHRLKARRSIHRADVAAEPLITLAPGYTLRNIMLEYLAGYSPRIACEALNQETVRRLVAARLGVTLFPQHTFEALGGFTDDLAARPLADSSYQASLWLLHRGAEAAPATAALVDSIRQVARQRFSLGR